MAKKIIIGIDLGTTNSEAAHLEGGRPTIIPSAEGSTFGGKMFPSVVAFTKDGERLVGDLAKRQAVLNPERTIMRIKRKRCRSRRDAIRGWSAAGRRDGGLTRALRDLDYALW